MDDWIATFQHIGVGTLRREPTQESTARGLLAPGCILLIADEADLEGEFVRVKAIDDQTKERMEGYVKLKYVQWMRSSDWMSIWVWNQRADGPRYGRLNDFSWFENQWTINSQACRIRVSQGGKSEEEIRAFVREAQQMGVDPSGHLKLFQEEGYTYVSLEIGRPYSKERGHVTCNNFHITLAYAAGMWPWQQQTLKRFLETTLETWLRLPPLRRPHECLHMRQVRYKKPEEAGYDIYKNVEIVAFTEREIEQCVNEGRMELPREKEVEPLRDCLVRLWHRDSNKLAIAAARAEDLYPHSGEFHMHRPSSGLGATSLELHDILAYLSDRIFSFPPAYGRNEQGKLLSPRVTSPDHFHSSRQGDWYEYHTF